MSFCKFNYVLTNHKYKNVSFFFSCLENMSNLSMKNNESVNLLALLNYKISIQYIC